MKRRAADGAKLRRPIKRTKIADGLYSSTLLYLKFLLLWAIIILADFILEFRFEFLWPFWMLLRSVYDSFKYQGLAFSMFFVCIALTSDMICFFFIPVQWVFFAASTYVWVQYVWYTDKGICLPTVILCSVFVYVEAGVRLRDLRHVPAHLDLCRPFAAHCIGYPVVTLGFGFKSYVGYRMRKRRQREVARENSFYMQLLQQALPPCEDARRQPALKEAAEKGAAAAAATPCADEKHMNGSAVQLAIPKGSGKKSEAKNHHQQQQQHGDKQSSSSTQHHHQNHAQHNHGGHSTTTTTANHSNQSAAAAQNSNFKEVSPADSSTADSAPANSHKTSQNHAPASSNHSSSSSNHKERDKESAKAYAQVVQNGPAQNKHAQSNGVAGHACSDKNTLDPLHANHSPNSGAENARSSPSISSSHERDASEHKSVVVDLANSESDVSCEKYAKGASKANSKSDRKESNSNSNNQREEKRKNKNKDRESNKERESDSSGQKHAEQSKESEAARAAITAGDRALRAALAAERQARAEITQLRQQNEQLSVKLSAANSSRQADRAALTTAERRLTEERRARQAADARLRGIHKSGECVWEWCRQKRAALEQEVNNVREELQQAREHNQTLQQTLQAAEQQVNTLEARSRDSGADTWHVMKSLKDRIAHLEHSLSAETRVKLDLFSAVGETKRQLGLREDLLRMQEKEMDELKGKIAQMLAVMPNDSFSPSPSSGGISKLRLSSDGGGGLACYPSHLAAAAAAAAAHHNVGTANSLTNAHNSMANSLGNANNNNNMSNLDPNATAYTPKGNLVQCSSAAEA